MSHNKFRYAAIAAASVPGVVLFARFGSITGLHLGVIQRIFTSFFFPAAAGIIVWIMTVLAAKDPFRANYARFRRTYEILLDAAVLLILGVHVIILGWIWMGLQSMAAVPLWFYPTTFLGIILVATGNILPRLRPNSVLGIRTPWTLRREGVWMKTHRVGGYVVVAFGLALIACTFVDFQKVWWVIAPGLAVCVLGLPFLSYVFWRRLQPGPDSASETKNKEVAP